MQLRKLSITLSNYLGSLAQLIIPKKKNALLMKNISLEIEKVSYSGEFYLKATLEMVKYIGQL